MREGRGSFLRRIAFLSGFFVRPFGRNRPPSAALAGRRPVARAASLIFVVGLCFFLSTCAQKPDRDTLVMIIESSPTNLDPRLGIDAQSERIDQLLFDDLLTRDQHFNVLPGLAERWDTPDPLTYIFHLHRGVRFHDGRPLTSRDVKWTFDSLLEGRLRSTCLLYTSRCV